MKLFLFILFLLLFIPIPLKISIYYSKENYYIKLFNLKLLKKGTHNENEDYLDKSSNLKKQKNSIKKKKFDKSFFKTITPKIILKALDKNKFKPLLFLKGSFSYSLNDAAYTAILYGLLSSLFPLLLRVIRILFKTSKFKLPIKPLFKNELLVKFEMKSIIFFSLVQIIYMIFLILKETIIEKEAKPLKGEI
ncbi:DUF2953 domain-containing protein [Clostridium paraputrificum]|uniref:DUF2953 domain-containing protein n=1 Tax=Clostridium TaxID=1485 RepID=UPI003D337BBD